MKEKPIENKIYAQKAEGKPLEKVSLQIKIKGDKPKHGHKATSKPRQH